MERAKILIILVIFVIGCCSFVQSQLTIMGNMGTATTLYGQPTLCSFNRYYSLNTDKTVTSVIANLLTTQGSLQITGTFQRSGINGANGKTEFVYSFNMANVPVGTSQVSLLYMYSDTTTFTINPELVKCLSIPTPTINSTASSMIFTDRYQIVIFIKLENRVPGLNVPPLTSSDLTYTDNQFSIVQITYVPASPKPYIQMILDLTDATQPSSVAYFQFTQGPVSFSLPLPWNSDVGAITKTSGNTYIQYTDGVGLEYFFAAVQKTSSAYLLVIYHSYNTDEVVPSIRAFGNTDNYTLYTGGRVNAVDDVYTARGISTVSATNVPLSQYSAPMLLNYNPIEYLSTTENNIVINPESVVSPDSLTLQDFSVETISPLSHKLHVQASDPVGIKFIIINYKLTQSVLVLNQLHLVSGTVYNGAWEIPYTVIMKKSATDGLTSVVLVNQDGEQQTFAVGTMYRLQNFSTLDQIPERLPPFNDYIATDFRSIYFNVQSVNLSSQGSNVTLTLCPKVAPDHKELFLTFLGPGKSYPIFNSVWDTGLICFKFTIYLPARMFSGPLLFALARVDQQPPVVIQQLSYTHFYYNFVENATLQIDTADAYQLGPQVISFGPGTNTYIINENTSSNFTAIQFHFVIDSEETGMGSISWRIYYNNSTTGIYKSITTKVDADSNSLVDELYSFKVYKSCKGMTLRAVIVSITDKEGSVFSGTDTYIGVNNLNADKLVTCESILDLTPPTITQFSVSSQYVNTNAALASNRQVSVIFTVHDDFSGVNTQFDPPVLTLSDSSQIYPDFQSNNCQLTKTNISDAQYTCVVQFGLNYGYPNTFFISHISNVFDNQMNILVYNGSLTQFGFHGILTTTVMYLDPEITSTSNITSLGGQLQINGIGMVPPSDVYIKYQDSTTFILVPTSVDTDTMKVIQVKQTLYPFNIKVVVGGSLSSPEFTVTPTLAPTPPPVSTLEPVKCVGSPECGGPSNGVCTATGCQCFGNWTGNGCLSKPIDIPPPPPNPTTPTTTLVDTSNAIISIISIEEVDTQNNIVFNHTFPDWNFENTSDSEYLSYRYTTQVSKSTSNQVICNITVDIKWYTKTENITFANEIITMSPSTMKYTIDMTAFPFDKGTNTLRLKLAASISDSAADDSCTAKEFGTSSQNNDIKFMKLQVNSQSLYGRFIERGILDGRIAMVSNTIHEDEASQTSDTTSTYISIAIPHYSTLAQLDPDFSLLVDVDEASDKDTSICKSTSSDSGLSKNKIIAIAVTCSVVGAALLVTTFVILLKKSTILKIKLIKLKSFL
ncbi:EGF-like domain-containing protein [Tieghemostelium lacteum]|uniref:EGF-like domain-containing protein n=1 Tax=Tieghemostelium lacteum TaxID=361077 RepID=A0A151Z7V2_TIELA|nr:EGF-like domain-containing protein [Tieghemostelium lacteum]|eukprot:KYQ90046.1 EGF-like domain-containing protein [Tieghemostelium lacteum]